MASIFSKSNNGMQGNGIVVPREAARWLALGMVAGPILMTLAWIVLGLMRPETKTEWGISGGITGMITQPFSGLGLGPNGSLFNVAFVLNGLLLLAGVIGIFQSIPEIGARARWGLIALFALTPLGSVIDGIFTIDLFMPHMIGFLLAVGTPVIGFLAAGLVLRRIPRWRRLGNGLLLASPLTLLLLVLFFLTFQYDKMAAGIGVAGLTERILVLEVQAWFVAMGWSAFRHS